jgi:hypothetical protein
MALWPPSRPYSRSKEDILSEIRRLQSQMAELEDRVSSSAKVMNGGGLGIAVALSGPAERSGELVVNAAQVASSERTEQENKDK